MKALVTGSLGSHLVERLLERKYEVRVVVRKTSNISHLKTTTAEIVFGDVEDYESLRPRSKVSMWCTTLPPWSRLWADTQATSDHPLFSRLRLVRAHVGMVHAEASRREALL